jgi:hypothetical protein
MRLFIGMILGALLTIGITYVADTATIGAPGSEIRTTQQRPVVNWDVVAVNWHDFTSRVRHAWNRLQTAG